MYAAAGFVAGVVVGLIGVFAAGIFRPERNSSRVGTAARDASQIAAKLPACAFSFGIASRRRKISLFCGSAKSLALKMMVSPPSRNFEYSDLSSTRALKLR